MLNYTMTPAQSDDWTLGGAAARKVAEEITEQVAALTSEDVLVLVGDGSIAFQLEQGGGA